jgi:hypothetical protein
MSEQKQQPKEPFWAWLTRFRRRKHEETALATLAEVKQFKDLMAKQPCTACGQNGLVLGSFKRSPLGWEAEVSCDNCYFRGVVNSEGFDFKRINSKGQAVDK